MLETHHTVIYGSKGLKGWAYIQAMVWQREDGSYDVAGIVHPYFANTHWCHGERYQILWLAKMESYFCAAHAVLARIQVLLNRYRPIDILLHPIRAFQGCIVFPVPHNWPIRKKRTRKGIV